jgi:hypothetical protein
MSFGKIVQEITRPKDTTDHCVRESERSSFESTIKPFEQEVKRTGGKIVIAETNDPSKADVHLLNIPKDLAVRIDAALK